MYTDENGPMIEKVIFAFFFNQWNLIQRALKSNFGLFITPSCVIQHPAWFYKAHLPTFVYSTCSKVNVAFPNTFDGGIVDKSGEIKINFLGKETFTTCAFIPTISDLLERLP